jgi:hypothetical protein
MTASGKRSAATARHWGADMSKIAYAPVSFRNDAADVVRAAEVICAQYAAQGYRLTLRQLYYRFIATDAFPESRRNAAGTKNNEQNYKWLGDLVSKARVGGLIDWNHVEDRTRAPDGGDYGWDSPQQFFEGVLDQYGITHWDDQPEYVEVWVEKEALADVIARPARALDVLHFACKGSPSTSAIHTAAQRLRRKEQQGRNCTVIYLGDHDPTGIDISRDIQDRLALFRSNAVVDRVALNMDQVQAYDPPPSPVKLTDSRTSGYIDQFGTDECWELDALEPAVLEQLITDGIEARLDREKYDARLDRERAEQEMLTAIGSNWERVTEMLYDEGYIDRPEEEDGG